LECRRRAVSVKGRKETAMVRRALLVWVALCVVRVESC
jgi:hypothetical protein